MKKIVLFSFSLLWAGFLSAQTLALEEFASGLDSPVDISVAPGDDRLYVTERDGTVRLVNTDGTVDSTPFLNIEDLVASCGGNCEIGLLGLAFHPDFATNGFFYVNYTAEGGGDTHVSRFSVSAANPNVADPGSEVILLDIPQPFSNHNGGCSKFGPDGYLYIGMGDGGSGGDPMDLSQNRQSLLGKMLRIDVDSGSPYAVPADNPFVGDDETLDEIWSIGLRNPWRFSFDRETGDMWIGDVGQNEWEEIDYEPAGTGGLNYGWRCKEGFENFNTAGCPPDSELTDPVHVYSTTNGFGDGCSVTGGFVYRGCDYPELYGKYIYGDFCSSRIWAITNNGDGTFTNTELLNYDNNEISGFGEDNNGELYMAALNDGKIFKITETSNPFEITSAVQDVTCSGDADGAIDLTVPGTNTFVWSNGMSTEDLTGLTPGDYVVTITTEAGCEKVQTYTVAEPDAVVATVVEADGTLSVEGNTGEVMWMLNGVTVATGVTFTPMVSGEYSAVFTNADGCEVTTNTVTVVINSTDLPAAATEIKISPNPFKDVLQAEFTVAEKADLTLRILNAEGKEMYREKFTAEGTMTRNLTLSNLPTGVYFMHLGNEESESVRRLVKE